MSWRGRPDPPSSSVHALLLLTECAECGVSGTPQTCQWDAVDKEWFCRRCFELANIRSPNPEWTPGPSVVCTRDQGFASTLCDEWRERLESGLNTNKNLCIGFDIEWRPNYVKGETPNCVALLQLCEPSGTILLTRLVKQPSLHEKIIALLTHPNVVLLGIGVKEDVKKLVRDFRESFVQSCEGLKEKFISFCDLGEVAKKLTPDADGFSLKKLAAIHGIILSHKTKSLTMTDWEKKTLTPQEVMYGAQDAECGLKIALAMRQKHEPSLSLAAFIAPHVNHFEISSV